MKSYQKNRKPGSFSATFVFLLLLFMMLISLSATAQEKKLHFRFGLSWHRIVFEDGYGGFLKERYGAEHVDLIGNYLGVVYQLHPKYGLGIKRSSSNGAIKYKTLNSESEEFLMSYSSLVATANWYISPSMELMAGFGFDTLKRESYGYTDSSIDTTNLSDNSGSAEAETTGTILEAQFIYRALEKGNGSTLFGLELAVTYVYGSHLIGSSDKRPAYDDQGQPINSIFDLSGLGYTINFALDF